MIFARISSFLSRSNNTFHRQQQQVLPFHFIPFIYIQYNTINFYI